MLSNFAPVSNGCLVLTDRQTAGRGQGQNDWQSPPGENITASIYLQCGFIAAQQLFVLNAITSLAVLHTAQAFTGVAGHVKWPNDVYLNSRKHAGILIENTIGAGGSIDSIIGIGLNVNQTRFSPQLANTAGSLALTAGKLFSLKEVLTHLARQLEGYYRQLQSPYGIAAAMAQYNSRLLWLNQAKTFRAGNTLSAGVITGVNDSGMLIVNVNNSPQAYRHKEIEFL